MQTEPIESLDNANFELLASNSRKKEIFRKIGYTIDISGNLRDQKTNEMMLDKKGEAINLNKSSKVSFISGSHNFITGIVEYSEILAKEGALRFIAEA